MAKMVFVFECKKCNLQMLRDNKVAPACLQCGGVTTYKRNFTRVK